MGSCFASLRFRMMLIVFLALVPAWVLMLYDATKQRHMASHAILQECLHVAESSALRDEQIIEGTWQLLNAMSRYFLQHLESLSECDDFLKELKEQSPRYSNLGVLSPHGDLLCSASSEKRGPIVVSSSWLRRVLKSRRFQVGDFQLGSGGGKSTLVMAAPVTQPQGALLAAVFAAVDLAWLNSFTIPDEIRSLRSASLSMVDQNGVVLSHYPNAEQIGSTMQDRTLVAAIKSKTPQIVEAVDEGGIESFYAVAPVKSRVRAGTASVVMRLPRTDVYGEANRALGLNLLLLAGMTGLIVATVWIGGNMVFLRELEALVGATIRLASGDLQARSGLGSRQDELGHLARTFDGMAAALELREQEHQQAEMRIRHSEEQLRRLGEHVQRVKEEERRRLAREIHDDLGQAFTALKIDLAWLGRRLRDSDAQAIQEKMEGMVKVMDDGIDTVHRICAELRPRILDDLGLAEAIDWQAEEFQKRTGIECDITTADAGTSLSSEQSIALYRVFQESLTNIAQHADASRIEVNLEITAERLELTITDNGSGISPDALDRPDAFGILGIRERIHSLKGQVEISGEANVGTRLRVGIPLAVHEHMDEGVAT
jgi:signal transduction histidine kinase